MKAERRPGGNQSGDVVGGPTESVSSTGVQAAVDHGDPWWLPGAGSLVQAQPVGTLVCACTLVGHEFLGEPDSPSWWGAVFQTAARSGVIERVGYHRAIRSARQGGVHAVWRRVQPTRVGREAGLQQ